MVKIGHDCLELGSTHLAMSDTDSSLGHQLPDNFGRQLDRLDIVVNQKYLSTSQNFSSNGLLDQVLSEGLYESLNW